MENEDDVLFCVCRSNEVRDMIGCDKCGEWFHYDCVFLTNEIAELIVNYYCYWCRNRDSVGTIIDLESEEEHNETRSVDSESGQDIEIVEISDEDENDNDPDIDSHFEKMVEEADGDCSTDKYDALSCKNVSEETREERNSQRIQKGNEGEEGPMCEASTLGIETLSSQASGQSLTKFQSAEMQEQNADDQRLETEKSTENRQRESSSCDATASKLSDHCPNPGAALSPIEVSMRLISERFMKLKSLKAKSKVLVKEEKPTIEHHEEDCKE